MPDISNPHDKFFKKVFSQPDVARDFLHHNLPENIRNLLDLDRITIHKDSFIDQNLKTHFSDLLFSVPLINGEEIYVYTLFEHKSYPDSWVALQLLRYMVRIWDRDEKTGFLRPIIPLVIYYGEAVWGIPTEFAALFPDCEELRSFLPNFHYLIYDLPRYPENKIVGEYKLRMAIWIMKYIFNPELLREIRKILSIYRESKRDMNAEEFLKTVLLYMLTANSKVKHEDLEKELNSQLRYIGAENIMMTLAEHYIQQGMQKGRKEGQVDSIKKILNSRFGTLPSDLIRMIEAVDDPDKLDDILTAAVSVNSIDDFEKNL